DDGGKAIGQYILLAAQPDGIGENPQADISKNESAAGRLADENVAEELRGVGSDPFRVIAVRKNDRGAETDDRPLCLFIENSNFGGQRQVAPVIAPAPVIAQPKKILSNPSHLKFGPGSKTEIQT